MINVVDSLINNCNKNDVDICFNIMTNEGFKYQYTWRDYLINVIKIASAFNKLGLCERDCILLKYTINKNNNNNNDEHNTKHNNRHDTYDNIDHRCFFIMMSCIYMGIFFVNVNENIDIETHNNIHNTYGCKLVFSFKNNSILWNNYSTNLINNEWKSFDSLLNMGTNTHVNPFKNNNNILENKAIQFVVIDNDNDNDKKMIEMNNIALKKTIEIINSNYNIDKGRFVANNYPLSVESIIFDFYFHVMTMSCLYIGDKISNIRPTFIHGDDTYWNNLYKNIEDKTDSNIPLFYLKYWIIICVMNIVKKINLFYYSHDIYFDKSSVTFMCVRIFAEIIYWTTRKLIKLYKMFLGLGLNKCQTFINTCKKIDANLLKSFYELDIPIKFIFSSSYSITPMTYSYIIISMTNVYEPHTFGHPITDIQIDNFDNIYIVSDDKKKIYIGHKGTILNNGKLQLI